MATEDKFLKVDHDNYDWSTETMTWIPADGTIWWYEDEGIVFSIIGDGVSDVETLRASQIETVSEASVASTIVKRDSSSAITVSNVTTDDYDINTKIALIDSDLDDLADDIASVTGIDRLTTLDISTANKTTDLDQYLTAGSDPKEDGYQVLVTWSGGDATYSHCFTSTYNLKNQFVDKAVGDNSSTYAWCGYGTGGLLLEKDEANSCWHILTNGCFDTGTGTNGDTWRRYTDFTAKETILISGTASTSAGGAWWYSYAWTYVIPLSSYYCFSATGSNYAIGSTSSISETLMTGKLGRMDGTDVSVSGCLSVCGKLRD